MTSFLKKNMTSFCIFCDVIHNVVTRKFLLPLNFRVIFRILTRKFLLPLDIRVIFKILTRKFLLPLSYFSFLQIFELFLFLNSVIFFSCRFSSYFFSILKISDYFWYLFFFCLINFRVEKFIFALFFMATMQRGAYSIHNAGGGGGLK